MKRVFLISLGVLPGGKALAIEVKTERGKLSEHQERFFIYIGTSVFVLFVVMVFSPSFNFNPNNRPVPDNYSVRQSVAKTVIPNFFP